MAISQISSQNLIVKISLHFYAFWLHFAFIFIFTFEVYSERQECGCDVIRLKKIGRATRTGTVSVKW